MALLTKYADVALPGVLEPGQPQKADHIPWYGRSFATMLVSKIATKSCIIFKVFGYNRGYEYIVKIE
jgi:hypothetical protein